ncbi:MAG: hypothetical protein AAGJ84_09225 [Pseudomonadota bacterium]
MEREEADQEELDGPDAIGAYRWLEYWICPYRHSGGWGYTIRTALPLRNRLATGEFETIPPGTTYAGSRVPPGILFSEGYETREQAIFGGRTLIEEWSRDVSRVKRIRKEFGRIGNVKRNVSLQRELPNAKLLAVLRFVELIEQRPPSQHDGLSYYFLEATNRKNPTELWRTWIVPGFEILTAELSSADVEDLIALSKDAQRGISDDGAAAKISSLAAKGESNKGQIRKLKDIQTACRAEKYLLSKNRRELVNAVMNALSVITEWSSANAETGTPFVQSLIEARARLSSLR